MRGYVLSSAACGVSQNFSGLRRPQIWGGPHPKFGTVVPMWFSKLGRTEKGGLSPYKTAPKCALLLPVARKMCPSFASDENCATNREEREGVDDHLRVILLHGALVDLHDRVFHLLMVMHHPFLHIYAATRIPVELSPHDIQTGG